MKCNNPAVPQIPISLLQVAASLSTSLRELGDLESASYHHHLLLFSDSLRFGTWSKRFFPSCCELIAVCVSHAYLSDFAVTARSFWLVCFCEDISNPHCVPPLSKLNALRTALVITFSAHYALGCFLHCLQAGSF